MKQATQDHNQATTDRGTESVHPEVRAEIERRLKTYDKDRAEAKPAAEVLNRLRERYTPS